MMALNDIYSIAVVLAWLELIERDLPYEPYEGRPNTSRSDYAVDEAPSAFLGFDGKAT